MIYRRRLCVALLCAALGALGLGGAPADAAEQFGRYGAGPGEFIEPNGIAVDQENGDVYVLDTNNRRIDRFRKDGVFVLAWGWGVADGKTKALQTCTAATACFGGLHGMGAGQLSFAEGLAVDNDPLSSSHHDVYAVDIHNYRVEKYSPTGQFLLMFGGGVNATAHERGEKADEDVCPVQPGDRCQAGTVGPANGHFEFPVEGNFIAVGSTGTVYVGDRNRVQEFSSSGAYQSQVKLFPALYETEPGGTIALVVNASGDLYVVRNGVGGVREYTPQGELLRTLDEEAEPEFSEGPTPALAIDPAGNVFVDYREEKHHHVVEYDRTGAELASFDAGMEDGLHGLAYGSGMLYVVNTNSDVTPPAAVVRMVLPPQRTNTVFSSFEILPWLTG
jgi:DNA-binding beta-propeller fold protein YncE